MEHDYKILLELYKTGNVQAYQDYVLKMKKNIPTVISKPVYKKLIPYPTLEDTEFNRKIYAKQEFNRHKEIEDYTRSCDVNNFTLTANQKFIRAFISPNTPYDSLILFHGVGVGKCHGRDTPIIMFDGTIKKVQDIIEGDLLMGDDSTSRLVYNTVCGYDTLYKIIPKEHGFDTYTVNKDHILCLYDTNRNICEISVEEYLKLPNTYTGYKSGCIFRNIDAEFELNARDSIEHDDILFYMRSLGHNAYYEGSNLIFNDKLNTSFDIEEIGKDNYYGFTISGNGRYLLGDFTVTHNTCTAISIAEQFHQYYEKKILVILSSMLVDNFKKQIYDSTKLSNQCTGDTYPNQIFDKTPETLDRKINTLIKERYKFMGYKELANFLEKLKQNKSTIEYQELIHEYFSNRLIIIDEAHNLRVPSETGTKVISEAFLELLKYVENTKLILLTATPMFNTATEIVWTLNMLLTNDKRPTIKTTDIFDKDGNLININKLRDASRSYISYMRGENPLTFPFRIWPSMCNSKDPLILKNYPTKDIYGHKIKKQIQKLEIITSYMSTYQRKVYDYFKKKLKVEVDTELDDDNNNNNDLKNTMQVSNVVYPNPDFTNIKQSYGSIGFEANFQKIDKQYTYRKSVDQFLEYDNLDKYAPKIKTIIDYIKKSTGIVFIYSRYYSSGILPLVIALEHCGFNKYSGKNYTKNINVKPIFKDKPKYIVLSKNNDLSHNNQSEISLAKDIKNINGEQIKVIIVSKVGTEGIDFKYIREIHLLEPWFNMNRAEQIIGRGVRNCSHIALPIEHRNVTIYFHANCCDEEEESCDLRIYRIAEEKQKKIVAVEKILKENAIDCNLNINMYPVDKLNKTIKLVTSQGTTIPLYKIGDSKDSSYNLKCHDNISDITELDETTFNKTFISNEIQQYKKYISQLFPKNINMTFEQICDELKECDRDIMKYTLDELILSRNEFNKGYLLLRGNSYIFQNIILHDKHMTIAERKEKTDYKTKLELVIKKPEKINHISLAKSTSDLLKVIEKNAKDLPNEFNEQIRIDYIIDRLNIPDLIEAARLAITGSNKIIRQSLDNLILLNKYFWESRSKELYVMRSDGFKKAGPLDRTKELETQLDLIKNSITKKPSKTTKGYVYYKGDTTLFKVKDYESVLSGSVCGTAATIGDISKRIKEIKDVYDTNKNKKTLCLIYELALREENLYFERPFFLTG